VYVYRRVSLRIPLEILTTRRQYRVVIVSIFISDRLTGFSCARVWLLKTLEDFDFDWLNCVSVSDRVAANRLF